MKATTCNERALLTAEFEDGERLERDVTTGDRRSSAGSRRLFFPVDRDADATNHALQRGQTMAAPNVYQDWRVCRLRLEGRAPTPGT